MSQRYDCFCPGDSIVNLKPLEFEQIETNDGRLTYRADVMRTLAPGSPVFRLTLSTKLPEADRELAEEQFRILRAELLVDFLLIAPGSDDELSDEGGDGPDPDESPATWEVQMLSEVLDTDVRRDYGAVCVLQAPIPGLPQPSAHALRAVGGPYYIRAGMRHIWTARAGTTATTVTSHRATQYVNRHRLDAGDHRKVTSDPVRISNYGDVSGIYTMTGRWKGPVRKPI